MRTQRCITPKNVADTRGRYTWQTRVADMQSKTSDTIAAPVKVEFPLTLLQLLQKLNFSRLIVIAFFVPLPNS